MVAHPIKSYSQQPCVTSTQSTPHVGSLRSKQGTSNIPSPSSVQVLNFCYHSGSLTLPQHRGVISMSFTKGNHLDIQNWHPISLLNVDYKLAARAVADRLLKVIHLTVAKHQTCRVPSRYIRENVAFLQDVVSYATTFDSPVVILSLDQEKAFDRVDWNFMHAILCKMGFGTSFLKCVNLFYTGVQSSVIFGPWVSR